jgi:hypothetical protein
MRCLQPHENKTYASLILRLPHLGLSDTLRARGLVIGSEIVVEMISELHDPLNARGGPVKLYRPAISYISICKGLNGPSELKES